MAHHYLDDAKKYMRKFEKHVGASDLAAGAAILANVAQAFMQDAKTDIQKDGMKIAKKHGRKNLRKIERFVGLHPSRNYLYALGAGAVLTYLFMPRSK